MHSDNASFVILDAQSTHEIFALLKIYKYIPGLDLCIK